MTLAQQTGPLIDWEWISRNMGQIVDRTWEHVTLTAVSGEAPYQIREDTAENGEIEAIETSKSGSPVVAAAESSHSTPWRHSGE